MTIKMKTDVKPKIGFDASNAFSPADRERALWRAFIADGRAKPWMNSLTVCQQRAKNGGKAAQKLLADFAVHQAVKRLTKK